MHIETRSLWMSIFLLSCLLGTSISHATSRFPISDGFWIWAGLSPNGRDPGAILYLLQGHFQDGSDGPTYRYQGPVPRPLPGHEIGIVLTYRLSNPVDPNWIAHHYRQQKWAWQAQGAIVRGLQIDYDCPTSRLTNYAAWLAVLRSEISPQEELSITGLPDWLVSSPPEPLFQLWENVEFIAFMLYRDVYPVIPLEPYLKHLSRLDMPFRIGLLEEQMADTRIASLANSPGYTGRIIFLIKKVNE